MSEINVMSLKRRKKLMTKKVPPAWYQRYMSTLPVGEQVFLQPLKELKEEDKMLKDATPHVKSEDKTKELVKALEKEKAMKIEMVLDLVAGDPNKMRDRVALIKPSTNPIKYIQDKKKEEAAAAEFRYADAQGNPLTFTQYLKFMKPNYFKENSKWKLLVENKVIRQKIKHLIKQKYQQEIQQKWRKAIRRVRAVLRFFQIIANIARTTTEVFKKFRLLTETKISEKENRMMVFDKHLFKSTSGGRELDTEILFHLGKPEHYRTWEEAQKTAQALKFIRSFSSLPRLYQERLAMIAWYMEVPADKVIIREGHIADSFYFLITGKVVAVKLIGSPAFEHRSKFKVLKVFDKDEMFGEEGISNRGNRGYSVTSIVKCTLLSVNIDDYYRICNYCSSPDENPDHIRMLSQMDFMKYFPMQELIENNEGKVILFYYRKGLVITPDSGKSEYIYIVKSGTCQLLTCVKSLRATKRYKCVKVSLPPIKARRGTLVLEPPPLPECRVFPDNSDESCKLSAPQLSAIITKQEEEPDETYESKHTASAMVHWASQDILESSAEQSREAIDDKESLTSSFTEFSLTFDRSQNRVLDSALTKCYNENRRDCAIPRNNMLPKTKGQLIRPPKSRPKLSKVSSKKGNSKTTTEWNSNHLTSEKERRLVHNDPIETQPNSDGNNSYVPKQSLVKSLPKQGDALLDKYAPGTILNTSESIAGLCEDSVFEQKMEKYVSRWKKSSISKRTSEYSKVGTVFQKAGSIEKFIQTQRENSESDLIWLRVKTLRESDVYGIEDLNLGDTKETNETKVALVSDGAEVILVSKEFIMANAGPAMKAYLRSSSYIKPDRDTLFLDLQKREYWSKFQEKTVNAFENELHISRKQEN